MNAFRQPRSMKRRSTAMIVDEKEEVMVKLDVLDNDSPKKRVSSHKKRRVSRLTSTKHGYDPRKSPSLRIKPGTKFSPLRLGYLPPPTINFDGSSSESESEEVKPKKEATTVNAADDKKDLERGSTPRRPLAVARRLHFGISPEELNEEEKKGECEEENVPRRNSLPVLRRSPRVRDLADTLQNL